MTEFHFFHPVEVRYSDLDPQGHLNNARYLTYFEQARINYVIHTGLWDGKSFLDIGIIIASAQINFLAPVVFGQQVHVGVGVTRLGNKSLTLEYCLRDSQTGQELANGSTVVVAYDYHNQKTIPIPTHWRQILHDFESLTA